MRNLKDVTNNIVTLMFLMTLIHSDVRGLLSGKELKVR